MKTAKRKQFGTFLTGFRVTRDSRSTIHALPKRLGAVLLAWWFRRPAMGAVIELMSLATVFFVTQAASAIWSATPTNANWVTGVSDNNWSTGVATFPGSTSVITNGDTATFTGTSTELAITINSATLNIKSITFSGAGEPAYTIGTTGGNSLFLTNAGTISIASNVTGASITNAVNAPLVLEPASSSTSGSYTFSSASGTVSHPLVIGGTVTGGTTSQGIALTLQGGNTGANAINGIISNGGAANVSVIKDAGGTWTLSGANTFTGGVTIHQGILKAGSSTALGPAASATLTFDASSTGKFQLNGNNTTVIDLNTNATVGTPIIESGSAAAGTDTLTVNTANTDVYAGVLQNGSTRLLALTKSGAGTLTLSGANTYTGTTTINAGTLTLGASGVLSDSSNMILNGGTFSTGATAGFSETVGTLALNDDSIIALGTGSHSLTFAASNGVSWTAGKKLAITGWTGGFNGTSGTSGKIFVGVDATGLTAGQLAQISFSDGVTNYTATILSTGEVVPAAPTAVKLAHFNATSFSDGVQLTWESGFEVNNLGYRLYREQKGQRTGVTPSIVAGSTLTVGQGNRLTAGYSYSWFDPQGTPNTSYYLEAIDLDGSRQTNGPIYPYAGSLNNASPKRQRALLLNEVNESLSNNSNNAGGSDAAGWPASSTTNLRLSNTSLSNISVQQTIAAGKAVKIQVRQSGWYRVTQSELVAAGFDASADARLLQLYVDGEEVPILLSTEGARLNANDTLEFYGVPLDTPTTDARIYWLINGKTAGKRISVKRSKSKGDLTESPGIRSFAFTTERREKLIYSPRLLNGDADNIFGALIFTEPTNQTLSVRNFDLDATAQPQLEVAFQGLTAQGHEVHVMLNGADLGDVSFNASQHANASFTVNRSLLRSGDNTVSLASRNGGADISFVDFVRLTYAHQYIADNNALRFSMPGGGVVRVEGFTTPNIRVVDITNPNSPLDVTLPSIPSGSGYSVRVLAPGSDTRTLMAFADDLSGHPSSIAANKPSNWNAATNGADLMVITHKDFRQAIEPLVALRRSQGLSVVVVDVEDVYDEFSYGAHTPSALKNFLSWAASHWSRKPAYLLLVGDSSWDPRNYMHQGDNDFVPTKLIDTGFMETASDDWLVDFNSQAQADVALGRLPGRTADEISLMVSKIMAYEQERELNVPLRGAVMVADTGFESKSADTRALLPASIATQSLNRADIGNDDLMRGQLLDALNQGPMIVNFYGHGSVRVWTGAGVLDSDLADNLTNANRPSIYMMMTCLNGYAHDAYIDSLSESVLKAQSGGAVAVWASSGFTTADPQFAMDSQFYRLLFGGLPLRLGEAARQAKLATPDLDVRRTWILFGDPTMRVR
jgi:autotransporter-associated beta strand protein